MLELEVQPAPLALRVQPVVMAVWAAIRHSEPRPCSRPSAVAVDAVVRSLLSLLAVEAVVVLAV